MCGTATRIFVIGGGEIYQHAMPKADLLYVTWVQTKLERGDTTFPEISPEVWQAVSEETRPSDEKNVFAMRFVCYRRK
jgi:dihydrofolate reductase